MGDRRKCQTYTASPAEPGGLPVMLVRPLASFCAAFSQSCFAELPVNETSSNIWARPRPCCFLIGKRPM